MLSSSSHLSAIAVTYFQTQWSGRSIMQCLDAHILAACRFARWTAQALVAGAAYCVNAFFFLRLGGE